MRVLVTGANTPLGLAVAQGLAADPAVELVVAVGGDRPPRARPTCGGRLVWPDMNLGRPRDLRTLLCGSVRELGVDAIVHMAHYRAATASGRRVRALNVDATRELLHLTQRHSGIRRFVYRSSGDVYRSDATEATVLDEEHPLAFFRGAPQWLRDRVEADTAVCSYMGLSPFPIAVLRLAEVWAPECGSQIFDYVRSRVCFRPLGYDPMLQLLTLEDAAHAVTLAVKGQAEGVFNIPGKDVLPLSEVIAKSGRRDIPVPGPFLAPLYGLRTLVVGGEFRYAMNSGRFHFGAVLDGARARRELGYVPRHRLEWPAEHRAHVA